MYNVHYTVYNVYHALVHVHYTVYNVYHALVHVHYTLYNVYHALVHVHYTVYYVYHALVHVHNIQYMYIIKYKKSVNLHEYHNLPNKSIPQAKFRKVFLCEWSFPPLYDHWVKVGEHEPAWEGCIGSCQLVFGLLLNK